MRRILFAFALVLLVGGAHALSLDVPADVPTNTPLSIAVEFDSLDSFSDAVVQLDGSTIVELYTRRSSLYIDSSDKSKVLAESIDGQKLYLLLNGFRSEGGRTISVEEIGKEQQSATVNVFIPVSKDFEEEYLQQFNSLKNTIMSYANDIDDLKVKVDELEGLIASKASASELQSKLDELSASIGGIQGSLDESASQLQTLQQSVDEQGARLGELEQETEEFIATGFISFAAIQNETTLTIVGTIIVIIVIVVLVTKGKVSLPKLLKPKGKEKSIYTPSKEDEKITSQVLEEARKGKEEPKGAGKWAFKGGSWKPKEEESKRTGVSRLGDLIKRD